MIFRHFVVILMEQGLNMKNEIPKVPCALVPKFQILIINKQFLKPIFSAVNVDLSTMQKIYTAINTETWLRRLGPLDKGFRYSYSASKARLIFFCILFGN